MSAEPEFSTLVIERHEGVTTLRINRPEKKNAMSPTRSTSRAWSRRRPCRRTIRGNRAP